MQIIRNMANALLFTIGIAGLLIFSAGMLILGYRVGQAIYFLVTQ